MTTNTAVHVLAIIRFQADHAAAVHAAFKQHAINSRAAVGCLRYEVFVQNDAPTLITQETWSNAETETAHMAGPLVAQLVTKIGSFLSAAPDITRYSQLA
jgi:quinol monooxygenase YgiN